MKLRPQRNPIPFTWYGTDHRLRSICETIEGLGERILDHGLVMTPDMDFNEVIRLVGNISTAKAINIRLSEGTFTIKESITIPYERVYISGVPGATVIERTTDDGTPMITLSGREVALRGVRFDDSAEDTAACVKVTGSRCVVTGCVFDDCFRAIEVNGTSSVRVTDNLVKSVRDTSYAIYVTNGAVDGIMSGNVVETDTAATEIRFDDATLRWAIVGNQTVSGVISHRSADNHSVAGNPGTVTAR